jgi:hypothetical protein
MQCESGCVCVCVCVCVLRQDPQLSQLELFTSYRHRVGIHIRWLLIALGPCFSIALPLAASCCATTSMVTVLLLKRQRDENRTLQLLVHPSLWERLVFIQALKQYIYSAP